VKCQACSFDEDQQPPRQSWQTPVGFIEITGSFTVFDRALYREIKEMDVSIYACPLCGTLKIDLAEVGVFNS